MEEAYHHLLHYYSDPHPHNPNVNYHEPAYNFYEPHEPEIYYDYYEPPSEQESTLSIIAELTQKLDERLESMENQMNERFDKLEEAMGQVAEDLKELQKSQEVSEQVWTSPVALDVEPLVSLEPVHFDIAEETHDDVAYDRTSSRRPFDHTIRSNGAPNNPGQNIPRLSFDGTIRSNEPSNGNGQMLG
ncbi:hypothetical protein CASFOL_020375 [Castilleja foliolosa]|uniref:Uncharacterized protein n=1 Tax=Castilleja foliolosa TaxID=1961234 RepID=A0ABD3D0N2_9LAMI